MNTTTLFGNIGSEPVLNNVNDKTVVGFSLAVNKYWTDANGQKTQKTSWFQIEVWNRPNLMNNIKAGDSLLLTGEARAEAYINKEGQAVGVHKLVVDTLTFTTPKAKEIKQNDNVSTPINHNADFLKTTEKVDF